MNFLNNKLFKKCSHFSPPSSLSSPDTKRLFRVECFPLHFCRMLNTITKHYRPYLEGGVVLFLIPSNLHAVSFWTHLCSNELVFLDYNGHIHKVCSTICIWHIIWDITDNYRDSKMIPPFLLLFHKWYCTKFALVIQCHSQYAHETKGRSAIESASQCAPVLTFACWQLYEFTAYDNTKYQWPTYQWLAAPCGWPHW